MFDLSKLNEMMKGFQDMQGKMMGDFAGKTVEGEAGAGMVKVVMNGTFEVQSVALEESVLLSKDASFLQDLIRSAINDALKKTKALYVTQMKDMFRAP